MKHPQSDCRATSLWAFHTHYVLLIILKLLTWTGSTCTLFLDLIWHNHIIDTTATMVIMTAALKVSCNICAWTSLCADAIFAQRNLHSMITSGILAVTYTGKPEFVGFTR